MFNRIKKILSGTRFTAVDFGHSSIKLAQGKARNNSFELTGLDREDLEPGAVKEGEIDDISLVVESMEKLLQRGLRRKGEILYAPASGQIVVRIIELPQMPEDELEEAIRWEADDYLPIPIDRAELEYIILEELEEEYRVLISVIPGEVLVDYQEVFSQLNLKPKVANLQELALVSLLLYLDEFSEPSAIIDMGGRRTQVVIGADHNIFLCRGSDVGGSDFTEFYQAEAESWQEAEDLKRERGIPAESKDFLELESSPSIQIDNLIREIERSLNYYSSQNRGETVENIYFTGGGFKLAGLVERIEEQLNIEMTGLDFTEKLGFSPENSDADDFHGVSVGLMASEVIEGEG
ncbi:pilus assembly protein PilM [Halarsenatibacter silvermanii]|uniref:Type IV pilus assembly protein PilM n=1 Tax=Halarsenatibacter silvermanii TaxID=321763 RepID=A0A1G9LA79_9FIRM|nr:pilus assembly protein PilM [Halarsenatibacter silvermanii]SDL58879.1 type IV pilus assembly protein PilM [Halarsenatibacter silvermanii]